MRFAKGHGTGNDFVIVPDSDGVLDLRPESVALLCHRRFGIGGDGVLRVVRAARHPQARQYADQADWFMDYRNSDGSLASSCGNGIRVFARYLTDTGLVSAARFPIATRAGLAFVEVGAEQISVEMDRPLIGGPGQARIGSRSYPGTAVRAGNPNLVCWTDDPSLIDLSAPPDLDPAEFPESANVEFIAPAGLARSEVVQSEVVRSEVARSGLVRSGLARAGGAVAVDDAGALDADAHVRMRVRERGSGETLSCGTGACAVAAVVLRDAGQPAGTVIVDVPGGRLSVAIGPERCVLSGPAVIVATGDTTLA